MKTLLLEIGTEEIPAGYIKPALDALAAQMIKKLDENRIAHGDAKTYGTPRRLAVMVSDVADRQTTITEAIMGPPEKVAFDAQGKPLVPAVKFAEKTGITLDKLSVKDTEKGRYVFATITQRGIAAKTVLKKILPEVIRGVPFPKTMRWGGLSERFARPIVWLCALMGKETVGFALAGVKSNRYSLGHRFMSRGKVKQGCPEEYLDNLEKAYVYADIAKRRSMVEAQIQKAARQINGRVVPDDELVDIVTQLVEYPAVGVGTFDEKFLALPDAILITAMREHQKYFAVSDGGGKLMAKFIVVNNTPARDMTLVAKGHERVLRARLEDAMFFYKNDMAHPLAENVEKLKGVLFQADLGTMYDKTLRVEKITRFLAENLPLDKIGSGTRDAFIEHATRAAFLCKADLVSHVVVEFPKLQGIMGSVYAADQVPGPVSKAIEEHYRPVYSGGKLPETRTGAIVAIADKMDSICGCFSAGLIPSGASDPYALRRQGIGIIQIVLQNEMMLALPEVIAHCVFHYLPGDPAKAEEISRQVMTFLKDRMANLLADDGYSKDVIASVIEVSAGCVPILWKKVNALEALKKAPDFEPLAVAFKRVVNIMKKSDATQTEGRADTVSEDLFEDPCEGRLKAAFTSVNGKAMQYLENQAFDAALLAISTLRGPVDEFFDGVMVMADNPAVRRNRLALLAQIAALFETVADFSKINTP